MCICSELTSRTIIYDELKRTDAIDPFTSSFAATGEVWEYFTDIILLQKITTASRVLFSNSTQSSSHLTGHYINTAVDVFTLQSLGKQEEYV
jgi:hypothetical protein